MGLVDGPVMGDEHIANGDAVDLLTPDGELI